MVLQFPEMQAQLSPGGSISIRWHSTWSKFFSSSPSQGAVRRCLILIPWCLFHTIILQPPSDNPSPTEVDDIWWWLFFPHFWRHMLASSSPYILHLMYYFIFMICRDYSLDTLLSILLSSTKLASTSTAMASFIIFPYCPLHMKIFLNLEITWKWWDGKWTLKLYFVTPPFFPSNCSLSLYSFLTSFFNFT